MQSCFYKGTLRVTLIVLTSGHVMQDEFIKKLQLHLNKKEKKVQLGLMRKSSVEERLTYRNIHQIRTPHTKRHDCSINVNRFGL